MTAEAPFDRDAADASVNRGREGRGQRALAAPKGDQPWNAPTHVRDLFEHSDPTSFRVISRRPPDAPPGPRPDLTQTLLGVAAAATVEEMRTELRILSRAVEGDGNEDWTGT